MASNDAIILNSVDTDEEVSSPYIFDELFDVLDSTLAVCPHFAGWTEWFRTNMPVCYLKRVNNDPGLYRVHLKAIASFCGPENEGTTTVVRHRTELGHVISVLDTHNCPGTLLYNVKHTLPKTETMMYGIDVFCSLDDTVALSVYHYCTDYRRLERPAEGEIRRFLRFAEEVQLGQRTPDFHPASDYSQERLKSWLLRCTASYIRCTRIEVVYRMYLFDTVARKSGRIMMDWMMESDSFRSDLPPSDSTDTLNATRRFVKKKQIATAFWIYGCVLAVPTLKVLEVACRELLLLKLNIERAHTNTIWSENGTPNVLLRFLVIPTEELPYPDVTAAAMAAQAVAALRDALRQATQRDTGRPAPSRRVSFCSDASWTSDDIPATTHSAAQSGEAVAGPQCGYLRKQRRHGLVRYWQRRWVELRGSTLLYSCRQGARTQKVVYLRKLICRTEERHHAICLVDAAGRVLLRLSCPSKEAQAMWKQEILDAQATPPTPGPAAPSVPCETRDVNWEGTCLPRYERLVCLGRGTGSRVWKVRDRETASLLALKVLEKQRLEGTGMQAEQAILESLEHPFIAKLHLAFETPSKLFLLMDYYSGGTLQELVANWTRIPEAAARFYATEVALALTYLHSMDIIHRDLKLSNVLLSGTGHAILADFGIATRQAEAYTFCGTLHYLAPEVLAHQPYSRAVDWWCYAVMLYQLLTGVLPFVAQGDEIGMSVYHQILDSSPYFPEFLTHAATGLLQGLLQKEPARRYGFAEVSAHPFFAGVDWAAAAGAKVPCPYLPDN